MNIKSLLIGSAAALASATVVNAADAIVAAEPEPLEYVRICDAFGTGFFYIPGTETCLKIGGYARFQVDFNRGTGFGTGTNNRTSDWDAKTKGLISFDARSETELGALRGYIELVGESDGDDNSIGVEVGQAFIELGGFRAGKFDSWWDDGLKGETDKLSSNANFNSIRYVYDAGNWSFGVALDELQGLGGAFGTQTVTVISPTSHIYGELAAELDNNLGVAANLAVNFGSANLAILGAYDVDREAGAIRAILEAQLGSGTLGLAGIWASAPNAYYARSEWTLAASYALKATEKLTITPAVQWENNRPQATFLGNYNPVTGVWAAPGLTRGLTSDEWGDVDAWRAGLTVDYAITSGLSSKVSLQYIDVDGADGEFSGFVRLERSF